jgi:hypothetical protein
MMVAPIFVPPVALQWASTPIGCLIPIYSPLVIPCALERRENSDDHRSQSLVFFFWASLSTQYLRQSIGLHLCADFVTRSHLELRTLHLRLTLRAQCKPLFLETPPLPVPVPSFDLRFEAFGASCGG